MVSHANAPPELDRRLAGAAADLAGASRCAEPGRWLRNGVILGVLVAVAFSIAAEGLFFTALALRRVRRRLGAAPGPPGRGPRRAAHLRCAGSGVTAVVAGVLLAYPLWLHFAGPQRFHGTGFDPRDPRRGRRRVRRLPAPLARRRGRAGHLAGAEPDRGELVLRHPAAAARRRLLRRCCGGAPTARRRATLRGAGASPRVVFAVLSFGPAAEGRRATHRPAAAVRRCSGNLPVFNAALPARLALVVAPVIGLLLAYAVDQLRAAPPRHRADASWPGRVGFAVALVPLLPDPAADQRARADPALHHRRHLAGVRLRPAGC